MIASQIKILASFGDGTVAVGCNKANDFYFVKITQIKNPDPNLKIGDSVELENTIQDQQIILTFPTENQMLKVMAAFTNRTFDEMIDRWNKVKVEGVKV